MYADTLPIPVEERGLTDYLREIQQFPMLAAEEEFMYAKRWMEHRDTDAAHRLITSHLRLVAKIAMRYRRYQLPILDIISEGNIGLMKAVQKFDPDKGVRLSTYAMLWIKAAINEFVLKSWSLVRVGSVDAHKRLFFGLQKAKAKLKIDDKGDLEPDQVERLAGHFGISSEEFARLNQRITRRDFSLNRPISEDSPNEQFMDRLPDEELDPETLIADSDEEDYQRHLLQTAISELSEREQEIMRARWLADEPASLKMLGERFGISHERVRQIESSAMKKIKARIDELVGAENKDASPLNYSAT